MQRPPRATQTLILLIRTNANRVQQRGLDTRALDHPSAELQSPDREVVIAEELAVLDDFDED
jgi:hypothetical protein